MQSTRAQIACAILYILRVQGPLLAGEIARILSGWPRFKDVSRTEVNSILYSELADRARHDDEYRWSVEIDVSDRLEPDESPPAGALVDTASGAIAENPPYSEMWNPNAHDNSPSSPIPPKRGLSVSGPASVTPSTELPPLLRTVHRLRSGLPPSERLQGLTVGAGRYEAALDKLIKASDGLPRWLVVSGNYGEGKSHALLLIRELAHLRQFATCHLSGDGSSSALNHPQRFLFNMLASLEVPGRAGGGYEDLLHALLMDARYARALSESVARHFKRDRTPEVETRFYLNGLLSILADEPRPEAAELDPYIQPIVSHLTGATIRHRYAIPEMRSLCYALIRIAADMLVQLGMRGLLLLLDEVESVYTKLPNATSRRGAYRVLAALCESPDLQLCRVVMATTPDAQRRLIEESSQLRHERGDLQSERVEAWGKRFADGSVTTLTCKPLTRSDRACLTALVGDFYSKTYKPGTSGHSQQDWETFCSQAVRLETPVRLLIRQTVDFLDGVRYL